MVYRVPQNISGRGCAEGAAVPFSEGAGVFIADIKRRYRSAVGQHFQRAEQLRTLPPM